MMSEPSHTGSCACGAVQFTAVGRPKRGGLCHCMTCRKAHASAFNPFLVFDPVDVRVTGVVSGWESSPGYTRYFCGDCGSRVFAENRGNVGLAEYEISLGSFDTVGAFTPQYESWVVRREPWLTPLPTAQFNHDRQA